MNDIVSQNQIHEAVSTIALFPYLYVHQEEALNTIQSETNCIIATGTGSGKTESFLYP